MTVYYALHTTYIHVIVCHVSDVIQVECSEGSSPQSNLLTTA